MVVVSPRYPDFFSGAIARSIHLIIELRRNNDMSEDSIGSRKGDYEILGVLGTGGMGKVYKVRNLLSDRIEAMKVLLPNLADQKDLGDRFLREIKVLAGLSHPNIAALRTALTIHNQLVMILEYVEGTTLAARVEHGAIPCDEAVRYIAQVLSALSYAHKHQIIHRDIKPANMMLTPGGTIKLMDFGIARSNVDLGMTTTGTTLGSLAYMSPEQVKCEPVDARSDIYSVGISFYEMVTGQRPFQSDSNFSIMQAHLHEPPKLPTEVKPGLPVRISEIIMMAMEKDPAKRFQSADAFANALRTVGGSLGAAEVPQPVVSLAAHVPAPEAARHSHPTTPLTPARVESSSASSQPRKAGAPQMPPQPPSGTGHRGLYITLGALIVLMVLVAAGFSAPRWFKARANNEASRPAVSIPPAAPSVEPLAPAPAASAPAMKTGAGGHAKRPSQAEVPQQSAGDAQQAVQPDTAQLDELDRELDQLSSREMAITASLDALSREQNAQGMHLRGDMVEAQARMRTYLGKAQSAIQVQDAKSARKYLDLAAPEVERLERFLGR
jgi:eukaryotic-like serine/threonine-protein kinase